MMITRGGITITDWTWDETGTVPVDEDYYKNELEQVHALQMLLIAVGNLRDCCEKSDEFNDNLSKMKWFTKSLDELQHEVMDALRD